jgi:hypothetical protein
MARVTPLGQREGNLLRNALTALGRTTGLNAAVLAKEPKTRHGARPDATIEIKGKGKRFQFPVEIKTVDRAVALATAKQQLAPFGKHAVLIAPYLTAELANHCREKLDLQFIDTAGNAYLRAPGLFVLIRGERPQGPTATAVRLRGGGTATALRVIFVLLCKPELLNAPYREIVAAARVALGAVGWVFFDLRHRGYITGGKRARNRHLLEPERLLEEWVINYPAKLRPKLNHRRFRAPDPDFWQRAHLKDGALWGGETAAHKLTGHLKPATCTIYVDPAAGHEGLTRIVQKHRLRADPTGNVEILDKFWDLPADEKTDLVPPLLVYADLLATLDPRNLEIAKRIKEEYVKRAPHPA